MAYAVMCDPMKHNVTDEHVVIMFERKEDAQQYCDTQHRLDREGTYYLSYNQYARPSYRTQWRKIIPEGVMFFKTYSEYQAYQG